MDSFCWYFMKYSSIFNSLWQILIIPQDSSKCACARLTTEEGTCMVSKMSTTPGYNHRRLDKDQQSAYVLMSVCVSACMMCII